MADFSEELKYRIPEYFQGEGDMDGYLDACGVMFDEFSDTIKEHDSYKDYKKVPEARLALLAKRFAFNPPRDLPPEITRGIIRDIAGIYTTKGTVHSLTWIFRLIGWRSEIEYAWLLNPERYDPTIKKNYPLFFERDGLDNDISSLNSFIPKLNQGYFINDENTPYHADPGNYVLSGSLVIGRNNFVSVIGETNPYLRTIDDVSTDFNKIDYRNFVYGYPSVTPKGVFFDGHSYFSRIQDVKEAKIIGEKYKEENIIRYHPSVISTPYIVVKVDSEDYDRFTRPYVASDGTLYSYTTREKFNIAQTLIEFLLFEFVRPANVKIILLTSAYEDRDQLHINDSYQTETTAQPIDTEESFTLLDSENGTLPITVPVIGTLNFYIGAPSYLPYNSLMQCDSIKVGQESPIDIIANNGTFEYWRMNYEVFDMGGGMYETDPILLRSPSIVVLSVDADTTIFGRHSIEHDYVEVGQITDGVYTIRVFDYINLKFRTSTLDAKVNTRVIWEEPNDHTGPFTPYVNIEITEEYMMQLDDGTILSGDSGEVLGYRGSISNF